MTNINPVSMLIEAVNLKNSSETTKATRILKKINELWPNYDAAYYLAAELFIQSGLFKEAAQTLETMHIEVGALQDSNYLLATAMLRDGQYDKFKSALNRALMSPTQPTESRMLPFSYVTPARIVHDTLQLQHLIDIEVVDKTYQAEVSILIEIFEKHFLQNFYSWPSIDARIATILDPMEVGLLHRVYRRVVNVFPANRTNECFNCIDWAEKEATFFRSQPECRYVIVDDLLSPNTLKALQNYVLESWIWFNDAQKEFGYLGAYEHNGFRTPLIDQIATELSARLPQLLGGLCLSQVWAYRNVIGTRGVGVHADFAKININFWITDDSAKLGKSGGGLKLYSASRPEDCSFQQYNGDEELIHSFIHKKPYEKIDYKCNRAVIFDSALFHCSDEPKFGELFQDLRTNITLLYS